MDRSQYIIPRVFVPCVSEFILKLDGAADVVCDVVCLSFCHCTCIRNGYASNCERNELLWHLLCVECHPLQAMGSTPINSHMANKAMRGPLMNLHNTTMKEVWMQQPGFIIFVMMMLAITYTS